VQCEGDEKQKPGREGPVRTAKDENGGGRCHNLKKGKSAKKNLLKEGLWPGAHDEEHATRKGTGKSHGNGDNEIKDSEVEEKGI